VDFGTFFGGFWCFFFIYAAQYLSIFTSKFVIHSEACYFTGPMYFSSLFYIVYHLFFLCNYLFDVIYFGSFLSISALLKLGTMRNMNWIIIFCAIT